MTLQIRRGNDTARQGITPASGELLWTVDTKILYVGDGTTAGGIAATSGAPSSATYLVETANGVLSAERVVGNSTSVTANWGTAGAVSFERAALTGDVTASANSNSTTIASNAVTTTKIADDAVTYDKIQNVTATNRLLGRATAGAGNVEEITIGSGLTLSGTTLSASGGGGGAPTTVDYLVRTADATLTAERVVTDSTSITANWGTSGQVAFERAALTGDVTASANSNSTTIASGAVTFAKMQSVSANVLLGNDATGTTVEEITCTAAGRALLDDADIIAQRSTLGLGSLATQSGTFSGNSSGTNTGDQNLFSTIAVAGQSNVVADATSDTLTLVAGSNVTITTDASTDTITISATGGGGGGAPTTVDYLVRTADATLTAERVVTDSTSITANWGTAGQVAFERAALTGDVTASANSNATTIANDAVTFAKMQNSAAAGLSVIGRSTNTAGDFAEINAASDGQVLRRSGTSVGFGTITSSGVGLNALTLDRLVQSGSGLSVLGCPVNTTDNFSEIYAASDNHVLRRSGTSLGFGTVATDGIANQAITYAKIQDVATNRLLGRATAGSGVVEEITIGSGLSLTGTTLSSTGTGGVTDGDKGDITVSGTGSTWTIDNSAVTYAKVQNVANNRLLGRATAGSGVVEEITIGSGLALTGTVLEATASASVPDLVYIQMGIV